MSAATETNIPFTAADWERVQESHRKWWAGELGRPLIHLTTAGDKPAREKPALPNHGFTAFFEDSVTAEEIVDVWDYDLSSRTYLGDSFPHVWPNFGPGVAAAFAGATLETGNRTVWFHPPEEKEVDELCLAMNPENAVLQRIASIMQAAMERWQGRVQVGMTDLGGNLDVLSTFRPSEGLLLDLYDDPEAVQDRVREIHELWWQAFDCLNQPLQPRNPGYTAWTPILSEEPYYMLQCDFCYMISPDMFDTFVKPELAQSCKRLTHAFYHLDGPGELPHLESLLEIDELDGVQWVPGDGQPPITEWPEVHRKISDAGKKIQIWGGPETLDTIADQIGRADNIVVIGGVGADRRDKVERWMAGYGL